MPDPTLEFLVVNLAKIESIVEELPRIGSRRELKVKANEILQLTDKVRKQAYRLAEGEPKTYAPNFDVLWGGKAKKEGADP